MSDYLLPYAGFTTQQHRIVLEAICNAGQSNPILGFRDLAVDWDEFGLSRSEKAKAGNQCLRLFSHMGFVEYDEASKTARVKEMAREWYTAISSGDENTADMLFRDGLTQVWFTQFDGQPDWDWVKSEIQNTLPDAEDAALESVHQLLEYYGFLGGQTAMPEPSVQDVSDYPTVFDSVAMDESESYTAETAVHSTEADAPEYDGAGMSMGYTDDDVEVAPETLYKEESAYSAPDMNIWEEPNTVPNLSFSADTQPHFVEEENVDEAVIEAIEEYESPPTISRHPVHEEVIPNTPDFQQYFDEPPAPPIVGRSRRDDTDEEVLPPPRKKSRPPTEVAEEAEKPPSSQLAENDSESFRGPRAGRNRREIDLDSIAKARTSGSGVGGSGERRSEGKESGAKSSRQIPSDDIEMPRRTTSERKRVEVDNDEETVVRGAGRRRKSKSLEDGDVIDLRDIRRSTTKQVRDDDPLARVRRKMDDGGVQRGDGRRKAGQGLRSKGPRATPGESSKSPTNDEPDGVIIPIKIDRVMVKVILPPEVAEGLNRMELYDEAYRMVRNILESTQYEDTDETNPDDLD